MIKQTIKEDIMKKQSNKRQTKTNNKEQTIKRQKQLINKHTNKRQKINNQIIDKKQMNKQN